MDARGMPIAGMEVARPVKVRRGGEYRITAREALEDAGLDIEECSDSIVPACCKAGCEVEPDGRCEHDCPSVLIALGLI